MVKRTMKYVNVAIPEVLAHELIDPLVKTGRYVSRADVVKTALRLLEKNITTRPVEA